LRIVAGLEQPDNGAVVIDGVSMAGIPPARRNIAMAFQRLALYPRSTVEQNLRAPLEAGGLRGHDIRREVADIAALLEMSRLLARKVESLSGGEQQRVALGRALIRKSDILLLDEPLANIDSAIRRTLKDALLDLHSRRGMTVLYVTHDGLEAAAVANRVVVLERGRVSQFGPVSELVAAPATLFVAHHTSEVPLNVGMSEVQWKGSRGRMQIADTNIEILVRADSGHPSSGVLQYALKPQYVRAMPGGTGRVERVVREGGQVLLRVLTNSGPWWASGDPSLAGSNVSIRVVAEGLLFFDEQGTRLPALVGVDVVPA